MIDWHDMTAYDDGLQTVEVGPALEVRHMHNILGNPFPSGTQFRKLLCIDPDPAVYVYVPVSSFQPEKFLMTRGTLRSAQ